MKRSGARGWPNWATPELGAMLYGPVAYHLPLAVPPLLRPAPSHLPRASPLPPLARRWADVGAGNVVLVRKNGAFPCDLVLLASDRADGLAYIETSNLVGWWMSSNGRRHMAWVKGGSAPEDKLEDPTT
jgi:hypothetical protein